MTALAALTMLFGADCRQGCSTRCSQRRRAAEPEPEPRRRSPSAGLSSRVLVIGFGRFGQVVNQVLLTQGIDVTVIDKDVERIRERRASAFGSITATARASTCCAPPEPTRPR